MTSNCVSIGLQNPKSPSNVGAVMRAAGCFGVDAVFHTGKRYERAAKFRTDTKQATSRIPLLAVNSLFDVVPENTKVVCVELVEGATSLARFVHPEHAFYVFGPEDGSLEQVMVNRADSVVFIPSRGCLNLAATVNVVLYDRCSKMQADDCVKQHDSLIRQSRDRNNRLVRSPDVSF